MTISGLQNEVIRDGVEVRKSTGGWSGTWNPRTTRPFAVFANGDFLRDKTGARRTFATREAARKAATECWVET